ncbi:glycosyltransferase [bacterium]|nr:glycosyltransferase [bacterium]
MKTVLFGDHGSPHVFRWVNFLEAAGTEVVTVGYGEGRSPDNYAYRRLISRSAMIGSPWGKLRSFLADIFLIRKENPDFVCVHFLTARYAALMLLLSRPCILTCWGSDILVDLPASRGLGLALRRAALARAARITCDSDEVLRAIASASPAAAGKTQLIFWGIDTGFFRPPEPERRAGLALREALGIPADAVLLLSNRLAAPNYRIKEIIERFVAEVRDEDTHLLVRLQPGADRGYVRGCKAVGAGNERIQYLERPLADAEMPALYAACDIVLHFPRSDATPVSMLEALASGCAVLCSDVQDAYRVLADDYHITRLPLESLDDAAVGAALALRSGYAASNAGTVRRLHSREKTVGELRSMIEGLVPGPAERGHPRGGPGRQGSDA